MALTTYEAFSTGLTYQDVNAAMWVDSDDSSRWQRRSRGAVLRLLSKIKQDMWAEKTGGLRPDQAFRGVEIFLVINGESRRFTGRTARGLRARLAWPDCQGQAVRLEADCGGYSGPTTIEKLVELGELA